MTLIRAVLMITTAAVLTACGSEKHQEESPLIIEHTVKSGPMSRIVRGDGGVSDFYKYTDALPDEPGVLLRQEPLTDVQSLPGAAQSIRLLYSSTDGIDGISRIPVSGSLFLPEGMPPKGGWPVIAWAHGTVGIADICAPTWGKLTENVKKRKVFRTQSEQLTVFDCLRL